MEDNPLLRIAWRIDIEIGRIVVEDCVMLSEMGRGVEPVVVESSFSGVKGISGIMDVCSSEPTRVSRCILCRSPINDMTYSLLLIENFFLSEMCNGS